MANRRTPLNNINQLLIEKRSERRRLNFELQYVNGAIQQLRQQQKVIQHGQARQAAALRGAKRGPGRPRKISLRVEGQPAKRGPGRPRKNPLPETPMLKRGPGRPRKNPLPEQAQPVKRGPGRPRKNLLPVGGPMVKPGPGRHRNEALVEGPHVKRGPGRPRKDGRPPASVAVPKGRKAKA